MNPLLCSWYSNKIKYLDDKVYKNPRNHDSPLSPTLATVKVSVFSVFKKINTGTVRCRTILSINVQSSCESVSLVNGNIKIYK